MTRVAREVGTEGKLGGQAEVKGVAGTWKDLTDTVNFMAGNLTGQVRNIAAVTTAVANGDLSKKITVDVKGEILELKNTINTMVDQLSSFAAEVTRVAREVGTEGKLGGQADVRGVAGTWKDLTDNVNFMAGNLTVQVRNIADVTTAVANGDLSKKITVDVKGEILELKNTINTMVDQLSLLRRGSDPRGPRSGHRRKARRPGRREGRGRHVEGPDRHRELHGRQPDRQVRNIAEGRPPPWPTATCRRRSPWMCAAKFWSSRTPSTRWWTSSRSFAAEVTRVAREVGTEGEARRPGRREGRGRHVEGPDRPVNSMAGNLTGQVRNIAEVTTAVANGDLSKKITVRREGRNPGAEEHHQHDGGPAQLASPRK